MADADNVEKPIDVAVEEKPEGENSVDSQNASASKMPVTTGVGMRNMIITPSNCPPGYQMDADGVCREVF
ncbi:unnamed protein product [Leptidea sinapis]|uniref:Uncharacterized protein n=1 Tax=Leptidea sinapis TaxID=189913 RepID=A0A5E4Q520_9NEOP|nr:unnamed protein product [Leptidea sinapis]